MSNRASTTVFPVTHMLSGFTPREAGSSARLRWERNGKSDMWVVRRRLTSSGKGSLFFPGPQAGFDVPDRNMAVVRSKRGSKRRSCVALHKHHVGPFPPQDSVHPGHTGCSHVCKTLSRLHDPKVIVGPQTENLSHLIEHFPVLPGNANLGREGLTDVSATPALPVPV